MTRPFLSFVVPVLNEAGCIETCVERLRDEVTRLVPSWEIVVADDGSTDGTPDIVLACAARDRRVRLSVGAYRGKGAAVRRGLLAASGAWRFMADADLSMPPDNLSRFLRLLDDSPPPSVLIGSREAPGSRRVGEPWRRHALGRVFNALVRAVALGGIQDTQCGYKLLSAEAAMRIAPLLTVEGFAFDVELLVIARRLGFPIREVGIVWEARRETRVALGTGIGASVDLVRIRRRWGKDGHDRLARTR